MNASFKSIILAFSNHAFLYCIHIQFIFWTHVCRNWVKICVSFTCFGFRPAETSFIQISIEEGISIGISLKSDCHVVAWNMITILQSCFSIFANNSLFLHTTIAVELEFTLPRDAKTFGSNDFSYLGSGKFGVKAHWRKTMNDITFAFEVSRRNLSFCVFLIMPSIFGKTAVESLHNAGDIGFDVEDFHFWCCCSSHYASNQWLRLLAIRRLVVLSFADPTALVNSVFSPHDFHLPVCGFGCFQKLFLVSFRVSQLCECFECASFCLCCDFHCSGRDSDILDKFVLHVRKRTLGKFFNSSFI